MKVCLLSSRQPFFSLNLPLPFKQKENLDLGLERVSLPRLKFCLIAEVCYPCSSSEISQIHCSWAREGWSVTREVLCCSRGSPGRVFFFLHNLIGLLTTEEWTQPGQLSGRKPNGLMNATWAMPGSMALASDPEILASRMLRAVGFSQWTRKNLLLPILSLPTW